MIVDVSYGACRNFRSIRINRKACQAHTFKNIFNQTLKMKTAFTFNGQHYLSPTKAEARAFLRKWNSELSGSPVLLYRFKTTWRFATIEKAPSYCQMMKISSDKVEFAMI